MTVTSVRPRGNALHEELASRSHADSELPREYYTLPYGIERLLSRGRNDDGSVRLRITERLNVATVGIVGSNPITGWILTMTHPDIRKLFAHPPS